jgi:hypothetical protein
MPNEQITLGEGVTEPIPIQMVSVNRKTSEETILSLVGASLVDMRIQTADKEDQFNYTTTNDPTVLAITDDVNGIVTFSPLGTEFDATEKWYECYFDVTDAGDYIVRIPSDGVIPIEIIPAF